MRADDGLQSAREKKVVMGGWNRRLLEVCASKGCWEVMVRVNHDYQAHAIGSTLY